MAFGIWDWLGIGLVFLVLELLITGVFLFWIGLAAISLALVMVFFPGMDWKIQALLFSGFTLGFIFTWTYFGRSRFAKENQDESVNLNSRTMNYIGQTRPLEEAIKGGRGVIIIDDSRWTVSGADLPAGELVTITAVEGSLLMVKPHA